MRYPVLFRGMGTSTGYRNLAGRFARCLRANLLVTLALAAVLAFGVATQEKESVYKPPVGPEGVTCVSYYGLCS